MKFILNLLFLIMKAMTTLIMFVSWKICHWTAYIQYIGSLTIKE